MANVPDSFAAILDDLDEALEHLDAHAEDYLKGQAYHEGTRAEVIANPTIARLINATAQVHKLNFAHIPVNSLFDKVELASITSPDAGAAELLAQIFDENDLEDEADDWHRKTGYFGDYYAIVDVVEVDGAGVASSIKIVGSSPLSTVVMYSSSDSRDARYAVKRWKAGKSWKANVYYDDLTLSLVTLAGQDGRKVNQYSPLLDDPTDPESYRTVNLADGLPVFHFRVDGKPYGRPVHRNAFGPQDSITKINATHLSAMDFQGYPQRYALQDPNMSVGDDDIDDDFGTDGPDGLMPGSSVGLDSQTTTTRDESKLKSAPGSAWILSGVKEVGQFDPASEAPFINSMTFQIRAMATSTGTPIFEFDLDGNQPSGEARRRASGGINKHARKVKRTLGTTWTNIADYVLAVAGRAAEVSINWLPTETETDKEGLELVSAKISAGVPVRNALLEAGYSNEQVDTWYPKGKPAISPELLAVIAEALGKIGQAVTLGTITEAEVVAMLPEILTGQRVESAPFGAAAAGAAAAPVTLGTTAAEDANAAKAKADALGALVRAGADPLEAAVYLGINGVDFPNVPTTVRVPEVTAGALEGP